MMQTKNAFKVYTSALIANDQKGMQKAKKPAGKKAISL